jgi:hypothetical protein|tara:strand:- start:49 stop:216 length:168 start_codon:yes stop_codon:yes gene_type:complete
MATYQIGFWYVEYGKTSVEAKSKKEAQEKVQEHLSNEGLENLEYETTDRDFGTAL